MKKVYKFTLEEDFEYASPILNRTFDAPFLKIRPNGIITIPKGYSFDGCTPKRKVFGKIIGTPDGSIHPETGKPRTYYCSLVHDALYQYKASHEVKRLEADLLFGLMLEDYDFMFPNLYYGAVRAFGWACGEWKVK